MIRRLAPKAYAALLCYLALSPVYFLAAAAFTPGRLWLAAVLPVPALLLTGLAGLRPKKRRPAALILAMLLMTAGCALLFAFTRPIAMLFALPCALTMLIFMPAMARPAHQEWNLRQLGAGALVHIAAQFLKDVPVFQSAAAPLTWCFVLYLLSYLFFYNRMTLSDTGSVSIKPLLLHNRKLLVVFCVLALLLTNIKAVGSAIRAAISWIVTAVAAAIDWLISLFVTSSEEGAAPGAANPFAMPMDTSEPSLFSQIMEVVLIVVGVLIAAVALFFFIKYLLRLLRKAFAALMDKLKLFKQRISADYVDQSESLLDWGEMRKSAAERLRRVKTRLLPTPWEKLSPAQRVRRVYALLLRRANTPDPALTAQEMLASGALRLPEAAAAPAAALYDRARYSTHPISAQEADSLRRQAGL